jgi:hypothetical protein
VTPLRVDETLGNNLRTIGENFRPQYASDRADFDRLTKGTYVLGNDVHTAINGAAGLGNQLYDISTHHALSKGGQTGSPLVRALYDMHFSPDETLGKFRVHPMHGYSGSEGHKRIVAHILNRVTNQPKLRFQRRSGGGPIFSGDTDDDVTTRIAKFFG